MESNSRHQRRYAGLGGVDTPGLSTLTHTSHVDDQGPLSVRTDTKSTSSDRERMYQEGAPFTVDRVEGRLWGLRLASRYPTVMKLHKVRWYACTIAARYAWTGTVWHDRREWSTGYLNGEGDQPDANAWNGLPGFCSCAVCNPAPKVTDLPVMVHGMAWRSKA